MGSDQISEIVPGVREAMAGAPDWCATYELSGDPTKWVQFTDGTLNAAYPLKKAPDADLFDPATFKIEVWEPETFVTGKLCTSDASAVSRWIDRYFTEMLGCDDGYSVTVTLEKL